MNDQVYMNIPAVQQIAKTFKTVGEVLKTVVKVMEGLILILKATAFMGMVGGYAVAQYLQHIKPEIERVSEKCLELSSDVEKSVAAYERGDEQGATRFH
jgi:hypothetical protein